MNSGVNVPVPLGRIGALEVRLAKNLREIRWAQKLRYHVFYEEMDAKAASLAAAIFKRDADKFDAICDHILVLDHDNMITKPFRKPRPQVVGTYRLLRSDVAEKFGGFYTASEYDIAPLLARKQGLKFLELGRSCVLKPYRNKRTVELLWHGIWTYVLAHKIDAMIGCASFEGIEPNAHAQALSFLHHNALAPEEWRVQALPERYQEMNLMPADAFDPKRALASLPPLIKGYLRVGAYVGQGAVIDHQFSTVDVCMIMPVANIAARYIDHFGADAGRFSGKSKDA